MADPAQFESTPAAAVSDTPVAQARRSLRRMIESYGLEVCADPWRCEALLRDLCPGCRREIFLLIAALKENLVSDLKSGLENTSEPVLVARLTHKLEDRLGLAAEPSQWAVQSWLLAVRAAPATAEAPDLAQVARTDLPVWPRGDEGGTESAVFTGAAPLPPGLDARWISLCVAGCVGAMLPLAAIVRVACWPSGDGPKSWFVDTAILLAGLGAGLACEFGLAWATAAWRPRRRPVPGQTPWVLLPELLLLLAGPLVLVAGPLLWLAAWYGQARFYGPPHDFAFHLGRVLQTLLICGFLFKWSAWMTEVQGRIATTLVRSR